MKSVLPHAAAGGLSVLDAVAMLVGVVVGIGIFGFPPLVAQQAQTPAIYLALWLAGGLIMLVGALCYAELGSTYPDSGGEYHFLVRAWGLPVGMLFAWARGTVIQTGSIAAVAFIYGDYAQILMPLGSYGPALHGAMAVIVLTALNVLGTLQSKRVQLLLAGATIAALLLTSLAGLMLAADSPLMPVTSSSAPVGNPAGALGLGLGMVFVLLTYGGWNEAAYLSGELRNPGRNMSRVLLIGTLVVTAVYLVVNAAYLRIFGLEGLRGTQAVGADLMRLVAGPWAAVLLSLLVCCTALGTINGSIFTGARVYCALGRDVRALRGLGAWSDRGKTLARALLLQAAITLALILFGVLSQGGIQAMVAYTAPVFWLFMFLTACAVIVLRRRDREGARPFRVPLYPLTPLVFAFTCLALCWSSIQYAGAGALLGLLVLAAGLPLVWLQRRLERA
ncbi:APC family permease [Pollutimonas sp. M17]|uniref:APC family permease n=1 Tax=Pollutimonas sp. M17 TaxID=2962065 RepID=UPI0021F457D0|nr:amino acid permease [Pollutimonas sp. M17]UYO95010.1 amino acid permease [Pollutimonas sp. M17]